MKYPDKPAEVGGLLRQVATTEVGGAHRFLAKDHLAEANVGWTNDEFRRVFLDLVEENVEDVTLNIHRLSEKALNVPILVELGDRARISLAHFFDLLKKQSKGEAGPLLTNGYVNIAYIIGSDGNVWAVCASWHGADRYWYVDACSVDSPYKWYADFYILSLYSSAL